MVKRITQSFLVVLFFYVVWMTSIMNDSLTALQEEIRVPLAAGVSVYEPEQRAMIPDKYNTGCAGALTRVALGDTISGVKLNIGGDKASYIFDFGKFNLNVSGQVVLRNYDFSKYDVRMYNEALVDRNVVVVFENCLFNKLVTSQPEAKISYVFNNCTFTNFYGSNCTFNHCKLGGTYIDALVPFVNVTVNDTLISDMASDDPAGAGKHTDGTQIYGFKNVDVKNIHYNNCRFELPVVKYVKNTSLYPYINACIMLQLEYSDGSDITVTDTHVNGGGYSIYAHLGTNREGKTLHLKDVLFDNVSIGCASVYGGVYPDVDKNVKIRDMGDTQSLYIGSVWKNSAGTHFSVTNDTAVPRELTIVTDLGVTKFQMAACPTEPNQLNSYAEYPFDVDIVVPGNLQYAVCYDTTTKGLHTEIWERSFNSSEIPWKTVNEVISGDMSVDPTTRVISKGSCGKDIEYVLYNTGLMELSGTGTMDSYTSASLPPWEGYKYFINKLIVGKGITAISGRAFRDCSNIRYVDLPEGLTEIGPYAFTLDSSLTEIVLPSTLDSIGDGAFFGSVVRNVYYTGSLAQWDNIYIDNNQNRNNVLLTSAEIEYNYQRSGSGDKKPTKVDVDYDYVSILYDKIPDRVSGKCGKAVEYRLLVNGVLLIYGNGSMDQYNSVKKAPWSQYVNDINKVIICNGVTEIGSQAFYQCSELKEVTIPDGVVVIGTNAFVKCKNLVEIAIPDSVKEIGKYAFNGSGVSSVKYYGDNEMWNEIQVGIKNEGLYKSVICVNEK